MAVSLKSYILEAAGIFFDGEIKDNFKDKLSSMSDDCSTLDEFKRIPLKKFLSRKKINGEKKITHFSDKEEDTIKKIKKQIIFGISLEENFIALLTHDFIDKQIKRINNIEISNLNFNLLLCRALKLNDSKKLIRFYTYANISRGIFTSLGFFIQKLLEFSGKDVYNGNTNTYPKHGDTKFDIVVERLNIATTYIEVKTGTNTMDKTQVHSYMKTINDTSLWEEGTQGMIGIASGNINDKTIALREIKNFTENWKSQVLIGQDLWNFVSGNENYQEILLERIKKTGDAILRKKDIVKLIDNRIINLQKDFDKKYLSMEEFYKSIW